VTGKLDQLTKSIRTVFMGSPDYAAIILSALHAYGQNIVGVVTQPDKRVGRGRTMQSSPVKKLADNLAIQCWQPTRLNTEAFSDLLDHLTPKLIVVAAYGKILRKDVLDLPEFGCINVHASLLPRWRGASPIQAAIMHGDERTGITIMKMDEGIDTGEIIAHKAVELDGNETADGLAEILAREGAELLVDILPEYLAGKITPIKQDERHATYAGLIKKEDGLISFDQPAEKIERMVRALDPWPTAFFDWDGKMVKIFSALVSPSSTLKPGERGRYDNYPIIGTTSNDLMLREVQLPGRTRVNSKVFLNGARDW
jgi:methionyl-tRNA formyltransferase